MTEQQQNEAVAKWHNERSGDFKVRLHHMKLLCGTRVHDNKFPSMGAFTRSRDSCALFEAEMTIAEGGKYIPVLAAVIFGSPAPRKTEQELWRYIVALPEQRVEAFLRAMELWKGEGDKG